MPDELNNEQISPTEESENTNESVDLNSDTDDSVNSDNNQHSDDTENVTSDTDEESNKYEPTVEEIDSLNDEEFEEWISSDKFPDSKRSKKPEKQVKEEKDEVVNEDKPKKEEIDYKAYYDQIFKPFKANGKEITPKSIEDVISLMQMGANYTKKMQKLTPYRKAAESLNRAGIGEEELAFLIDLHKGNKDAIKKLLKDNKVDITDIDTDEESKYQPNKSNLATDDDVNFTDALMDTSPENISKMKDILNTWDKDSQMKVYGDPALIRGLDWEISSGRYEQVMKILESERTFGRYKGYTDLQAYIDIAYKIEQQEKAKYLASINKNRVENTPNQDNNTSKKTNRQVPDKSKAAPSKGRSTPTKSHLSAKDLMEMPEEEFLKLSTNDLL